MKTSSPKSSGAPSRAGVALLCLLCGCVSGSKIRADAEVIRADLEHARRTGALKCAPRELATAESNLDFALGSLAVGSSYRAGQHIRAAEAATKQALALSRDCAPKQILVREKEKEKKPPPLVVKIEETDRDGDGIPDKDDKCPDQPEDKDGFQDADGCPEPDNDADGVLDVNDRCPNMPGPISNQGCPVEAPKDRDGDGIPDDVDKCPDQPEDKDGFQDADGCPEPDNDADGVVDAVDRCPNMPGPVQNFGCPSLDRDGDGIPDYLDKCPDQPEDKDGFQDDDGCPDLDNDGDGIPDVLDRCPNMPGPASNQGCPVLDRDGDGVPDAIDKCPDKPGPAENQGCPDTDRDGDGIPDRLDKCPDEPGPKEEGGCPKKYKLVVVKKDRIEIKQQINFKTGSSKIIGAQSFEIIHEVAQALKDHPAIKKIRVEGHTDSVGNDASNLRLSQRRADAVMSALIREGIDPGRMEAVGFGETRPIESNSTRAGRAANRRTEFNIIEQ